MDVRVRRLGPVDAANLGFHLEGHSPRYLRIGGEWRDHDHYALTAEEWPRA
jgi:ribosomal-protein-alanine N-acetyltransferase